MRPCRKQCVMKSSVCIVLLPGTHLVAVASRRSRNEELRSGALPRPIASNLKIRWSVDQMVRWSDNQMIRWWSDDDQIIRWSDNQMMPDVSGWKPNLAAAVLIRKSFSLGVKTCAKFIEKMQTAKHFHQLWFSIHRDCKDHFRLVLNLMFTVHMIHKPGVCKSM